MNVLILGEAGFGGSGLARRLVNKGYSITILDVLAPRHTELVVDLYEQDSIKYNWKSTLDLIPEDVKDFEIIFDFAAQADVPLKGIKPKKLEGTIPYWL